ncbi:MAG TPA: tetratricopeptide repeat protein [Burkholderiaceae bacterium]
MRRLAAGYWKCRAIWAGLLDRPERALGHWRRALALLPDDPRLLVTLACRLAASGRESESIALLERAVGVEPGDAASWFNLGFVQQLRGDHHEALESFERAVRIDPKLDRAWYGKALSLIKLGRLAEAVEPLEKTCALQPLSPYGWYQLGHLHHRRGERDRVARAIGQLARFEPRVARRLQAETGGAPSPEGASWS